MKTQNPCMFFHCRREIDPAPTVKQGYLLFICIVVVLVNISCSSQAGSGNTTTAIPTIPAGDFENPIIKSDFPDPSILQVGNVFYAYATNDFGENVQVARSQDMVRWNMLPDAMPALPTWAQPGGSYVWAPGVIQIGNHFLMYYTARDMQSNKQCVGVATSDKPEGKFHDHSSHALVCQVDQGGTIDPSPFLDGNKLYLYFKNDGNCCGMTTYLYEQQLSQDGLSVVGKPTQLVQDDKAWEGNVVEAPDMFKHNGKYYLFFSANDYAGVNYAVGYATCQTLAGPCQEAPENPILSSQVKRQPFVIGPGGESVIQIGNQTWIAYHAWNTNPDGSQGNSRYMWLDRITWQNDKPHVLGPSTSPEPIPTIAGKG